MNKRVKKPRVKTHAEKLAIAEANDVRAQFEKAGVKMSGSQYNAVLASSTQYYLAQSQNAALRRIKPLEDNISDEVLEMSRTAFDAVDKGNDVTKNDVELIRMCITQVAKYAEETGNASVYAQCEDGLKSTQAVMIRGVLTGSYRFNSDDRVYVMQCLNHFATMVAKLPVKKLMELGKFAKENVYRVNSFGAAA